MCRKLYRVYGWKTETEGTNWGQVYLYHELIGEATFSYSIRFTDKYLRDQFDLNIVNNGKVISLHNVI